MNHLVFIGLVVALLGVIVGTVFVTLYVHEQKDDRKADNNRDQKEVVEIQHQPHHTMKISAELLGVVLVIANFPSIEEQPERNYVKCYQRIMKYMTSDPRFYVIFIEFDETLSVPSFHNHRLIFPSKAESAENLYHKTILALQFVQFYFRYKYVIRTNISSLWYYPRLADLLEKNTKTFFGGHLDRDFLSGNGMIMTPDLVQYLIHTYDEYKSKDTISDDVRISHIIRRIFPQNQWTSIPYLFYNQENIQQDNFHKYIHYYCKGGGTDDALNQKVCDLLWGEDFQPKEIWGKVKEVA